MKSNAKTSAILRGAQLVTTALKPQTTARNLFKRLCALPHESLAEYLRTALDCPKGIPGVILNLHTFGATAAG